MCDGVGRLGQIDHVDFRAHGHDCPDRAFGQVQHAADHDSLAAIKQHLFAIALYHVGDFFPDFISFDATTAQQAQHRMRGTLTQRSMLLQAAFAPRPGQLVEQLDQNREADRCIQIAFGDVEAQAFCGQAETDHHQKAQAQHDDRRVGIDEPGQRLAGHDHDTDGENHRDHHDGQVFDHADCGDHRIQGEDRIEHHDLRHDWPEGCVTNGAAGLGDMALEALMQFHGRLEQQEHTTKKHDQVAPGEALVEHLEQRRRKRDHPGDARQQTQAHDQRQAQADDARAVALMRGKLVSQDGDEYQVVDTQHQFQDDKREQA